MVVDHFSSKTGQAVALTGPSGTGKTTLLRLISGLTAPIRGSVRVLGNQLDQMTPQERAELRRNQIGIVFQDFRLVDYLNVRDNIRVSHFLGSHAEQPGMTDQEAADRAVDLANQCGLSNLIHRHPAKLSQGEMQRTAIARALFAKPQLLLADEPTGNLDPETSKHVLNLLLDRTRESGCTLLFVTHDHSLLSRFNTHHEIHDLIVS